jgi:hypothetical protein
MMTETSVLEYAVMGAASVVGILAFDSLQEWIRTKIIRKKLMNGTYKESPKEFLASMQVNAAAGTELCTVKEKRTERGSVRFSRFFLPVKRRRGRKNAGNRRRRQATPPMEVDWILCIRA